MSDTEHKAEQATGDSRWSRIWLAGLAGLALGVATAGVQHWAGSRSVVRVAHAEMSAAAPNGTALKALVSEARDRGRGAVDAAPQPSAATPEAPRPDPWNLALAKALQGAPPEIGRSWVAEPAPTFVGKNGLSSAATALLDAMVDARHRGLQDPSGRAAELRALAEALPPASDDEPGRVRRAEAVARLEVALAIAADTLVSDLMPRPRSEVVLVDGKGRYLSPDVLTSEPPPPLDDVRVSAMRSAAREGGVAFTAWLAGQLPQSEQYKRLVEAARGYEPMCAAGGFPVVAPIRAKKQDAPEEAERTRTVQLRLAAEGYLAGEPTGELDEATGAALTRYQANQQLDETGELDEETIAALNVPCDIRLRSLRLNAQRWRSSARGAEPVYVEVNLAAQRVEFVVDGVVRMSQRTVVGTGRWFWNEEEKRRIYPKASPILHDEIIQVIVNPSWTVPSSIVRGEFQKRLDKDPLWLEKKGYVVVENARGLKTVVQPPGPKNTLGDVKMIFPNSESVYLHDTNQRSYFKRARRDLSHGCIRVHNALDFASELMIWDAARRGERWPDRRIHVLARSDRTYVFKLDVPIPIFIEYYTATVDDDGLVGFHWDIYDYDRVFFEGKLGRR